MLVTEAAARAEVGEHELYIVLPGASLDGIANELDAIRNANHTLTEYHRGRKERLTAQLPDVAQNLAPKKRPSPEGAPN